MRVYPLSEMLNHTKWFRDWCLWTHCFCLSGVSHGKKVISIISGASRLLEPVSSGSWVCLHCIVEIPALAPGKFSPEAGAAQLCHCGALHRANCSAGISAWLCSRLHSSTASFRQMGITLVQLCLLQHKDLLFSHTLRISPNFSLCNCFS